MKVPVCRVFCVGELTAWARQFLQDLEEKNVVEVTKEPSVARFCSEAPPGPQIPIVFLENTPDSRKWIQNIRSSLRRCYLVWFGRGFTKEDLFFAMENRVYEVLENPRSEESGILSRIRKVVESVERQQEFHQVVHSLKTTLLQKEDDESLRAFVNEIKVALSKLERAGLENEFLSQRKAEEGRQEVKLPFYRAQDFGDALSTVHDLERTGTLIVTGTLPDQEGKVQFLQGKIVGASVSKVHGLKAIYRMFLWDEPRFIFTRQSPDDFELEEHLTLGMKYIRMEGESLRGRYGNIRRELPPMDLVLGLEPSSLHPGASLSKEEFATLASVVEFGRVGQVVDYNPLPDVSIFESLISLKRKNMIRVVA